MAQRRILEQALPVMTELDRLIFQMETSLGKKHTVSPFQQYYPKQAVAEPTKPVADSPLEEKKAPAKKAKADKPKQEGKPKAAAAAADGENADAKKGKGKGNKEGGKKGGAKAAAAADPLADLSEELKAYA